LDPLIKVFDLNHSYRTGSVDEVKALNGIDLQINRGDMLAITGQNGSGKSTLARHFNGLLIPESGKVLVEGLSTADKNNTAAIRRLVGMVFQNPDNQLVSSIVEEDIAFGPENLGLPPAEIKERVDWVLETLNLQKLRSESPNQLSEGQKQLVAIAGVLSMKPRCIVLDEPTSHLDPRSRREVLENILRLNREEEITIVLVTHFMNEVVHCNRMIVMDKGKIALEGNPHEVFHHKEKILQLGLDFPVAAQLAAGLRRKGFSLPEDIIQTEELVNSLCRL
jgi:energy-coupling factor transport system ATP-binding protein